MAIETGVYLPSGIFKPVPPHIEKPIPFQDYSFTYQLNYFKELQKLHKDNELWQNETTITTTTHGLPFCIMPISDIHLGNKGTDYEAFGRYMKYVKDYPVHIVIIGDIVDNFSPTAIPSGMLSDIATPSEQNMLARAFFKEYHEKILCSVSGNHDAGTEKSSGLDIFQYLTEDLGIPLLRGGSTLHLKVDEQKYDLMLFHNILNFHSSFNATHAGKRALEFKDNADVIISGHRHRGGMEKTSHRAGNKPFIVACGTFKEDDDFQKNQGRIVPMQIFFPTLFFFANRHNVEAIEDINTAKEIIEGVQLAYSQRAVASLGTLHGKGSPN